ncbi:MAG: ABC transporter permease subunit [Gammaproteobacteria bacterium]|nr:ABC transporter permease subunit [Gammaproteobacteria bacterium]
MSELIHSRPARRLLAGIGLIVTAIVFGLPLMTLLLASIAGEWTRALPTTLTVAHLRAALGGTPRAALWHSLATGIGATIGALVLGVWGALVSRRAPAPVRRGIDALFLMPVAIPSVSIGLALLVAFSRPPLLLNGTVALVGITHVVLVTAYAYASAQAGIARLPAAVEDMAGSLGATPSRVLVRVTLPLLLPQLRAAAALGFALSMGELGATIMVYPPGWATAPVEIFSLTDRGALFTGAAVSVWLLAGTFGALWLFDRRRSSRRAGSARDFSGT